MVVVGIFFIRRQLSSRTAATGGFTAYPAVYTFSICTSVCSFCAQNAGNGFPALYLQTVLGRSEVETGLLLTPWPLATMVMARWQAI